LDALELEGLRKVSIPLGNIPLAAKALNTAYVSLWNLSGGLRYYVLNAALANVRVYLPTPTAGTRLVFVRGDAGTSGFTARVYGKIGALLNDSAVAYADLLLAGDAVEVVANTGAAGWITPSRRSSVR
jgi:hypothetical protein